MHLLSSQTSTKCLKIQYQHNKLQNKFSILDHQDSDKITAQILLNWWLYCCSQCSVSEQHPTLLTQGQRWKVGAQIQARASHPWAPNQNLHPIFRAPQRPGPQVYLWVKGFSKKNLQKQGALFHLDSFQLSAIFVKFQALEDCFNLLGQELNVYVHTHKHMLLLPLVQFA